MKSFLTIFSLMTVLFAAQASLATVDLESVAGTPCASDLPRFKQEAANYLSKFPFDKSANGFITEEKFSSVSPESLNQVGVVVTDAKDTALLYLAGQVDVKFSAKTENISVKVTALCSPATGRYELVSYGRED